MYWALPSFTFRIFQTSIRDKFKTTKGVLQNGAASREMLPLLQKQGPQSPRSSSKRVSLNYGL